MHLCYFACHRRLNCGIHPVDVLRCNDRLASPPQTCLADTDIFRCTRNLYSVPRIPRVLCVTADQFDGDTTIVSHTIVFGSSLSRRCFSSFRCWPWRWWKWHQCPHRAACPRSGGDSIHSARTGDRRHTWVRALQTSRPGDDTALFTLLPDLLTTYWPWLGCVAYKIVPKSPISCCVGR